MPTWWCWGRAAFIRASCPICWWRKSASFFLGRSGLDGGLFRFDGGAGDTFFCGGSLGCCYGFGGGRWRIGGLGLGGRFFGWCFGGCHDVLLNLADLAEVEMPRLPKQVLRAQGAQDALHEALRRVRQGKRGVRGNGQRRKSRKAELQNRLGQSARPGPGKSGIHALAALHGGKREIKAQCVCHA